MDEKSLREQIASLTRQLADVCDSKGGPAYAYCSGCDQVKPLFEFYRNKKGTPRCYCRTCWRVQNQKYRGRDGFAERIKDYERKRYDDAEGPVRRLARTRLAESIRTGKFPPAFNHRCYRCGKPADHYHHPNGYDPDRWDDVVPICRDCHRLIHSKNCG